MLTGAFASKGTFIITLGTAEEAVSVDLSQIQQQSIEPGIDGLDLRLKPLEGKLDFFLSIENLLDQPLAEVDVSIDVVQRQLGSDLGLLDCLVILLR